jgi:hypothetical protein
VRGFFTFFQITIMAKKELSWTDRLEQAIATMLPSNVSSLERLPNKPAPKAGTSGRTTTRLALENRGAGNTQVGRPNTQLGKPNTAIVADRPMRNVTPRGGGVAAPLAGAALSAPLLIPAISAALTTTLGDATERKEGDIQDIIAKGGETIASENRATENRARLQAEEDAQFDTPRAESAARERASAYRETGGSQRSPLDRQMTAPVAPAAAPAPAPAAAPAATERDINAFFETATGTPFNPKSRVDIARKAELEDFLKSKPELAGKSNVQASLQWYRQMANAKRK